MEAESFTCAVYRAAERCDVARLERTLPAGDDLRLRVMNHLEEVDSINRIQLLRVTHASDVQVFPTTDGRLLAVDPRSPVSAVTDGGRDVRAAVSDIDEDFWHALPSALPERRGQPRWMECRFPLREAADSVTLVLQVNNTRWGALLHHEFYTLFGSTLQQQYDLWNGNPRAHAFFHARMEEEAMLGVSVWDGRNWRHVGYVWEVGSLTARRLALRIGVADIEHDLLRVRLDAPGGLWQIGYAGLDARPPLPVEVTVLEPERARGSGDLDVRDMLRTIDGSYLALGSGEQVELHYRVPGAPGDGRAVTWLLDVTGYCRMNMRSDDPPKLALLARLFGEPGYFARYSDERFWETVMAMTNDR